jgi:signal transduction histidine kinase
LNLLNRVGVGLATTDANGRIQWWNRRFEAIFSRSKVLTGSIVDCLGPDGHNQWNCSVIRLSTGTERFERFVKRSDKKVKQFLDVKAVQPHTDGTVTYWAIEDVTQTVLAERRARELEVRTREQGREADRVRQTNAQMLHVQEEERRRFARDLHDSTGQLLSLLAMNLAYLERETHRSDPKVFKAASESSSLVEELAEKVRTTSYLLHPPLLDEMGLLCALRCYTDGLAKRCGLTVKLNVDQEVGRLSRDLEIAIFRVIQESLTNVYRHSGSPSATIHVSRLPDKIRVVVKDFGHGMADQQGQLSIDSQAGIGIRGMRERVSQAGGRFEIHSDVRGTQVVAVFPIRPDAHEKSDERINSRARGTVQAEV